MSTTAGKNHANPSPHPYVAPDTGDAPYGTVPRRSNGPLVFWICLYIAWLAALLVMAWQRFRHT